MEENVKPVSQEETPVTFDWLGLTPEILNRLKTLGFETPTPIQAAAIPTVIKKHDLIGIAQTGTGKTLAFGLPMIHSMLTSTYRGRGLIVLPTRELALQVEASLAKIAQGLKLKTVVLIGGAPMRPQKMALATNPDIIIATPGRLIDHLNTGAVDLRSVETLVLDEADRMLDMGFLPQIKQILRAVPEERQTLLFSATMPSEVENIANNYMYEPIRVEIARAGTTAEGVTQELFVVPQEEKNELLSEVLSVQAGSTLIFTRTRSRAHRVARFVKQLGYTAAEIHADRTLSQRVNALEGFKKGAYQILVATDIAARGIDVTGIAMVINYDLPDCPDDYVHRIGRTARAGRTGIALTFATMDQAKDVRAIEKVIQSELPLSEDSPGELPAYQAPTMRKKSPRGKGGSRTPNGQGIQRPAAPKGDPAPSRTHSQGPAPRPATVQRAAAAGPRASSRGPAQSGARMQRSTGRKFSGRSSS